jgi:hypothetical protein
MHIRQAHMNAAYYFWYGHYNAARAARELKDEELHRRVRIAVQGVAVATQEEDGAWTDHPYFGKECCTAMALMAVYLPAPSIASTMMRVPGWVISGVENIVPI